jgi:hypothetical protein
MSTADPEGRRGSEHSPVFHANGLLVLTLAGDQICGMTRFDNSALPHSGLPVTTRSCRASA